MISSKKKELHVRELRRRGLELVAQDQFEKAARVYVKLVQLEPEDGDWARRAADCFWQLKNEKERLKYSILAAEVYCDGGFLLKAIAMCKIVLSLDPQHEETQERLACLYAKRPLTQKRSPAGDPIKTLTMDSGDAVRSLASSRSSRSVDAKSAAGESPPSAQKDEPKRDARRERARLAAASALRQIRAQRKAQQDAFLDSAPPTANEMAPDSLGGPLSVTLASPHPPKEVLSHAPQANCAPQEVTPVAPAPSLYAISLRAHLPSLSLSLRPHDPPAVYCIELNSLPPLPDLQQFLVDQLETPISLPRPSEMFEPRMLEPTLAPDRSTESPGADLLFPAHLSLSPISPVPTLPTDEMARLEIEAPASLDGQSILAHFENIPLFGALKHSTLIELINQLELVELDAGQILFNEGDPAESMYVVTEGSILAEVDSVDGSSLVLGELQEGEFFGEIGLLSDQPRQARVRAQGPCRLLRLQRGVVSQLIATDPTFLSTLVEFLRQRLVDNLLQTSPLFAVLPDRERRDLADRFDFLEIEEDTVLLEPGERPTGMYVLLAGSALAFGTTGRSQLARLVPGAIFGEGPLLRNETSNIEVLTTSKCYALCLDAKKFRVLMMTHPTVLEYVASLEPPSEKAPYLGDHVNLY